ncbi:MAG: hypothetical protein EHM33_25135, partial [Chloroflexi bacterium]
MPIKQSPRQLLILLLLFALFLSACGGQATAISLPKITETPYPPVSSVEVAVSTPSPVDAHISDAVPSSLRKQVKGLNVRLDISTSSTQEAQSNETRFQWVYALVAPFPTVDDGVTFDELIIAWTEGTAPAPFNGNPLLMEESTLAALTALLDEPAPGAVRVVSADRLLDEAWSESRSMSSWAIIPFESLEPKWKVLTIDGQSPIR